MIETVVLLFGKFFVFFRLYLVQFGFAFLLVVGFLFVLFEIVPLLFGARIRIRENWRDFIRYQVGSSVYITTMMVPFILLIFYLLHLQQTLFNITHYSLFSQVLILYFCAELTIYGAHMAAHKYRVPILSKAHAFHHTITTDMDWVNSRKEHLFVISLFATVYCLFFFVVFKSSNLSHLVVTSLYVFFNAFSHFRIPFTLQYFDQVFLFPKDHLKHHTRLGGPYGVTLSLFDTIFNTRAETKLRKTNTV